MFKRFYFARACVLFFILGVTVAGCNGKFEQAGDNPNLEESWRRGNGQLFGGITIMQLAGQARGWEMPSQFLSMLPYLATIAVLVLISRNRNFALMRAPAHLGRIFIGTK